MEASLLWQYLVIAIAVLISLLVVIRKRAPALERRVRGGVALWMVREGRSSAIRKLGRAIAPRAGGQGESCGGCGGCGTSGSKQH